MIRSPQFYTKFLLTLSIIFVGTLPRSSRTESTEETTSSPPSTSTPTPPTTGETSATSEETSASSEAKSSATSGEKSSAISGKPPASSGETPSSSGETPESSGETPASAGASSTSSGASSTSSGESQAPTPQRTTAAPSGASSPLRLVNGSSMFEGRVEIFHDGQWGTICDDDADVNTCLVICRQLAFTGGMCMNEAGGVGGCEGKAAMTYGEGHGPIWVDDIKCTGVESNIDECLKSNWGVTNCQHKEDFVCLCDPGSQGSAVRLVNGSSPNEGRVEVYHNRTWGTVCDDFASDKACRVICRQLNLMGGKCVNENGGYGCEAHSKSRFGLAKGVIWIDELVCAGTENSIEECPKNNWGDANCHHKEDLGCICSGQSSHTPGHCDPSRHRLTANDPSVPGIGRVEIKDPVTDNWGVICDDSWNDLDATVFCFCLGYTEQPYFHSLYNQPTINASLPLLFDAVDCQPENVVNRTSLFDCPTEPVNPGRCDAEYEAAYVACTAFPNVTEPETPSPNVTCHGTMLDACFHLAGGTTTGIDKSHFRMQPLCKEATVDDNLDVLCYHIDFTICTPASSLSTNTTKPYCYDISYSAFNDSPSTLITDHTWSTRVCCAIDRNASADASFRPVIDDSSHDTNVLLSIDDQRKIIKYALYCFTETNFSGVPLQFPAVVRRGMELFCKVNVSSWDRNLYLVVTSCQFLTSLGAKDETTTYYIVKDKCITPLGGNVGLRLHSIDSVNWGFRFQMPKFQGFDVLYLSCATSVCDRRRDPKPDCDRSCVNQTRTRRYVQDDLQVVASNSQSSADDDQRIFERDRSKTDAGPFIVLGVGQDYVMSQDGDVLVFPRSTTEVPSNPASSGVDPRHHASMTQSALVHCLVVFCLLFL